MDFFDWFVICYLVVFYIIFISRTVIMRLKGIRPFVLGIGKRGFKAILELSLFLGLFLWTIEVITHSLGIGFHFFRNPSYHYFFDAVPIKIAGVFLCCIGLYFFVSALISFKSSWRVGIDTKQPGELITTSVFSITRNPIFLFLDLYIIGTFLIYGNAFFLISIVIVLPSLHFQISKEEKFLEEKYGKEYREYKKSVRRYI